MPPGNSTTATVNITITPVNDNNPSVPNNSFTVNEGGTATEADLDSGSQSAGRTDRHRSALRFAHRRPDQSSPDPAMVHSPSTPTAPSATPTTTRRISPTALPTASKMPPATPPPPRSTSPSHPSTTTTRSVPDNSFTVNEGGTATEADLDSGASLLFGVTDTDLPFDSHTVDLTVVAGPNHGHSPSTPTAPSATPTTAARISATASPTVSKMPPATPPPPPSTSPSLPSTTTARSFPTTRSPSPKAAPPPKPIWTAEPACSSD